MKSMKQFQTPQISIQKLNFFQKLFYILFNPSKLFESIGYEKGLGKSIIFFLILTIFILIGQLSVQLPSLLKSGFLGALMLVGLVSFIPLFLILVIGFSFLVAGIYHLIGKLLKMQGPFFETYKSVMYGLTPYLVIQAFKKVSFYDKLLIVNIDLSGVQINIFSVWSLILIAYGLAKLHKEDLKKTLLIVFVPVIIALIITFIFFANILTFSGLFFSGTNVMQPLAGTSNQNVRDSNLNLLYSKWVSAYETKNFAGISELYYKGLPSEYAETFFSTPINNRRFYKLMNTKSVITKNEVNEILLRNYKNDYGADGFEYISAIELADGSWRLFYEGYQVDLDAKKLIDADLDTIPDKKEKCDYPDDPAYLAGCVKTDYTKPDTDGDGWFDNTENFLETDPNDPTSKFY